MSTTELVLTIALIILGTMSVFQGLTIVHIKKDREWWIAETYKAYEIVRSSEGS